jgi:hypothetical protein
MYCNIAGIFQCSPIRIRADPEPDPDPNFYFCGFQDAKKSSFSSNFLRIVYRRYIYVSRIACLCYMAASVSRLAGSWANRPLKPGPLATDASYTHFIWIGKNVNRLKNKQMAVV